MTAAKADPTLRTTMFRPNTTWKGKSSNSSSHLPTQQPASRVLVLSAPLSFVSAATSLRTPVLFQQPVLSAPLSCFSSQFSPHPCLASAASSLSTLSCFSSQFSLHPCLVSAASSLRTPVLFQQPVLSAPLSRFSSQFSPHPSLVSAANRVLVFFCTPVLFQQPVLSAPLSCFSSQFSLHPSLVQQPVLSAPLCTPLLFQQPVLSAPLCAPSLVSAATQVSV